MTQLLEPFVFRKRIESASALNKYTSVYAFNDKKRYNIHVEQVQWKTDPGDWSFIRAYDGQFSFWMLMNTDTSDREYNWAPISRYCIISAEFDRVIFVSGKTLEMLKTFERPFSGKLSDLAIKNYVKGNLEQIPIFISGRYSVHAHSYSDEWGRPLELEPVRMTFSTKNQTDTAVLVHPVPRRMKWQKEDEKTCVMISMDGKPAVKNNKRSGRKKRKALNRIEKNEKVPELQIPGSIVGDSNTVKLKFAWWRRKNYVATTIDRSTIPSDAVISSSTAMSENKNDSMNTIISTS